VAASVLVTLDFEWCYRAVRSRDCRFDGWIYPAVTSTGVYCRPSCPAITPTRPKRENLRFYPTAAAAQDAGFRACRRCQPDAAPGSPEWDVRADVAARAMRLVDDGVVDREGVAGLAARLGYTVRHLNRVLIAELGAGPLDLARARRANTARLLLETTTLPITYIAYAAGFGSIRQFNDTIRTVLAATPTEVRHRAQRNLRGGRTAQPAQPTTEAFPVTLRLPYREPYDWTAMWAYLLARIVPGLEEMTGNVYRRTLRLHHGTGAVELAPMPGHIRAGLRLDDLRDLGPAVARVRRLLHADADPAGAVEVLGSDPVLGPLVRTRPGLRVPGSVDPFETAIRTVVGQQLSIQAARTIAGRLVRLYGTVLSEPIGSLTHTFPTAAQLSGTDRLPMPASRGQVVARLAGAVDAGKVDLTTGAERSEVVAQLRQLPGIEPWAAQYVALRGLGDPDVFPVTDPGIRQALATLGLGNHPDVAQRWRPLRSYAAQHLWTTLQPRFRPT
jgi:AraC family transcriptional regulator, regulatory protein of adaptative response / DNA-3-methyladenine glycosylase II